MPPRSHSTVLLALSLLPFLTATATAPDPHATLQALQAWLGGPALERVPLLRLEGRASEELPMVSSPGRAGVTMFRDFTELRDPAGRRVRRDSRVYLPMRPGPVTFSELFTPEAVAQAPAGSWVPGSPTQWEEHRTALAAAPEQVVRTALAAGDAAFAPDTVVEGLTCHVIRFGQGRSAILLGAGGELRGVEVTMALPEDAGWGVWGDLTTLTLFGSWALEPTGFRYPRSVAVYRNGRLLRRQIFFRVTADSVIPEDSLTIPSDIVNRYRAWSPGKPGAVTELAEGVGLVPGPFQVLLLRWPEHELLILGAPQSSAYSREVLARAAEWAPGSRIRGVVLTSGAWAHLSGVREYVARGIPVYLLEQTAPLVRRLLAAPHRVAPDSLAGSPRKPVLRFLRGPTILGAGPARVALYPNDGPGAVRDAMVTAWLAGPRILYASDLLLPERFEPNLWREPLSELSALARRNGIDPATVVSIHNPPLAWDAALAALLPSARSP